MNGNIQEPAASAAGRTICAQNSEPLLVTVRQTGELLRCGKTKVFGLINDGLLERRKLGHATRITMASIRKIAGGQ